MRSRKPERSAVQAAKEDAKKLLLTQYDELKQYATSIELDAASVKIRLENAREAAEAADRSKFEQLAYGIFVTLEERYDRITAARKGISLFANGVSAVIPVELMSSQESKDSPESQGSSSQLST